MSLSFAFLLSVYIGNGELPGWARGDAKRAQNFKKVRHLLFDMEVSKIQGNPPGSLTCFGVDLWAGGSGTTSISMRLVAQPSPPPPPGIAIGRI